MKRQLEIIDESDSECNSNYEQKDRECKKEFGISMKFIDECRKKFKSNPSNIIARNAISSVGSVLSTTNIDRVNNINHIFLNSVKKKHIRATNQGLSGRCWMFAALNIFRHILINALDLEDFEFSETYLFFWDKLERSNSYLKWFIENRKNILSKSCSSSDKSDKNKCEKAFDYMISDFMSDGGWWNTFSNLVSKYGVIPLSAMKETFQSDDSDDMNLIIQNHLTSTINYLISNGKKLSDEQVEEIRKNTMENIYNTLVKFLGEPPTQFSWSFTTETETNSIQKITPKEFLSMVSPDMDMNNDFVILSNIPMKGMKLYQKYSVNMTNNVEDGKCFSFFNLPINELSKYAMKSITNGFAVWFGGDVTKYFNPYHASLDDKLNDTEIVFGKTFPFSKGDRMFLKDIQSCHAMALTGFNIDEKGNPINWQVENSWGYYDKDVAGLDGFLSMSHSWFENYVIKIVIHKKFLSRSLLKKLEKNQELTLDPWDNIAPELMKIKPMRRFTK